MMRNLTNQLPRALGGRRRAQGKTEYIIICGLVAIFMIVAVKRYRESVRVAIEGGTTKVESDVNGDIGGSGPSTGPGGPVAGPAPVVTDPNAGN